MVGIAAVAALAATWATARAEGERSRKAWSQQVLLDHHARIYEAAANLIERTGHWASLARARTEARFAAALDGYGADADETVDPEYAEVLDTVGAPRQTVQNALADASRALDSLYFLIGRDGHGARLLDDLILLGNVFRGVHPEVGSDSGTGDLVAAVSDSGLRDDVEMLVSLDSLDRSRPAERIQFVEGLVYRYFRGRIGRFVPPPPLAEPISRS